MRFGSVCSGIEAASVAWEPLGWKAAWFAEIEPFPSAVLAHHYPSTPNLGDMTAIANQVLTGEVEAPDMLCGGTPCQAFSVAGLRASLSDARGNLALKFVELADAIDHVRTRAAKPAAVVFWENVPGVLSTKDNAFGCFLAGLAGEDDPLQPPGGKWANAGAVYGSKRTVAWRILDAQYFGVAQRRRRVFVVASARNDFDPAEVLFEWDSVRRDTAPSREAGKGIAATLDARTKGGGFPGTDGAAGGHVVPHVHAPEVARCIATREGSSQDWESTTMVAQSVAFHPTQNPISSAEVCHSIGANENATAAVAVQASQSGVRINETVGTLDANYGSRRHNGVIQAMQVRRLTPVECERLQGFPDNYTAIPWRKKPASECPDGPRYKALGNSWAVPNVRWLGRRIQSALERTERRAA